MNAASVSEGLREKRLAPSLTCVNAWATKKLRPQQLRHYGFNPANACSTTRTTY